MEILAWDVLSPYLRRDSPCSLLLGGSRGARIGYLPDSQRLWVRLPCADSESVPSHVFSEIDVEIRHVTGKPYLEVSSSAKDRFLDLYSFACILTEVFESGDSSAAEAFHEAVLRWQELTAQRRALAREKEVGLWGELYFLQGVIRARGAAALSSWTARDESVSQRHDFRLANADVEVKTTEGGTRVHVIHGLSQLAPAPGLPLYLLSVRIEPAGEGVGTSLPDMVSNIEAMLSDDGSRLAQFRARVQVAGYRQEDADLYAVRYRLADECVLIPVDEELPALTQPLLVLSLPRGSASRVSDVSYRLNVEGLGWRQSENQFADALCDIVL